MKKTFAVSKIVNGRVVEVKEINSLGEFGPTIIDTPLSWKSESLEADIKKWRAAESKLKTFPVAGEDGEVEKLAEEYSLKKHESVKPEAEDFEDAKEFDYQDAKGAYDFVFDESVEDFKEGFNAHAQKYGYSEEDMKKCFEAAQELKPPSLWSPDELNPVYSFFSNYLKHISPTIGQLVECEIENGMAKIIK